MRAITKGPEPAKLRAYRVPGAIYDGKDFTPVKDEIRAAVLRDQLALCCYCMRRISAEERPHPSQPDAKPIIQMKVEHWRSQDGHPSLQLAWTNLLGACLGGLGIAPKDQTCDTRKGESNILFNPLDPTHTATLYCRSSGVLVSTDERFKRDIDEHLGLNNRVLVAGRKAMLDRDLEQLGRRYRGEIPVSAVRRLVVELETPSERKLPELCGVLQLWARKRYGSSW